MFAGCGIKSCEFREHGTELIAPTVSNTKEFGKPWSAKRELFYKTLGFYTALREHGCSLETGNRTHRNEGVDSDACDSAQPETPVDFQRCKGQMIIRKNSKGQYVIEYVCANCK